MIDSLLQGFWGKVLAGALAAGGAGAGIAGTTAVIRTHTLEQRVAAVEEVQLDHEGRIRDDHDAIIRLRADVGYTRRAVDALLEAQGVAKPQ